MSAIKEGKKPVSNKPKPSVGNKFFRNALELDPRITSYLASKGLDYRFVNAKQMAEKGFHNNYWEVYQPKKHGMIEGIEEFYWGLSPDGIIKRGDAVLAVRPQEVSQEHKAILREKNDRLSIKSYNRRKAAELRQQAKDSNLEAEIHEGYEENND